MEQSDRESTVIHLMGTAFLVDVHKMCLREKANPDNLIPVLEMIEKQNGYSFYYDPEAKNLADDSRGSHRLEIPWFSVLDPVAMARKHGKEPNELKDKTDYEVMVDQQVLSARLKGRLTTLDIAGHTFFVDLIMDCIRPMDDFSTLGIHFSDLENYVTEDDCFFQIPYNPKSHQMQKLDYENITSIPEGVIMIEFPVQQQLDPVGYARKHGFDLRECLRETPIKSHFVARILKWEDTFLPSLIEENSLRKKQEATARAITSRKQETTSRAKKAPRRGPRL